MSDTQIRRNFRSVSSSDMLDSLGDALKRIKAEDGLTDCDLAAELGMSKDQTRRYCAGIADMPATVFLRACKRWDGRFAGDVLALVGGKYVPLEPGETNDRTIATRLTKLLLELSVALEDGKLSDKELKDMRRAVEDAGQAVDTLRERLKVRAA